MAMGYRENEQAFGVGDIAIYTDEMRASMLVDILDVWQMGNSDDYHYTVRYRARPDIEPFEVKQRYLELF